MQVAKINDQKIDWRAKGETTQRNRERSCKQMKYSRGSYLKERKQSTTTVERTCVSDERSRSRSHRVAHRIKCRVERRRRAGGIDADDAVGCARGGGGHRERGIGDGLEKRAAGGGGRRGTREQTRNSRARRRRARARTRLRLRSGRRRWRRRAEPLCSPSEALHLPPAHTVEPRHGRSLQRHRAVHSRVERCTQLFYSSLESTHYT